MQERIVKAITVPGSGLTFEGQFQDGTFTESSGQTPSYSSRGGTAWIGCLGSLPTLNSYVRVFNWRGRWWYDGQTGTPPPGGSIVKTTSFMHGGGGSISSNTTPQILSFAGYSEAGTIDANVITYSLSGYFTLDADKVYDLHYGVNLQGNSVMRAGIILSVYTDPTGTPVRLSATDVFGEVPTLGSSQESSCHRISRVSFGSATNVGIGVLTQNAGESAVILSSRFHAELVKS